MRCGSSEDLVSVINKMFTYPEGNIDSLVESIYYASRNLPSKIQLKKIIDRYDFLHTADILEQLLNESKCK